MKIFALSIFAAALCHGAAYTKYKKICPQPEASISVVHHKMPFQFASTEISGSLIGCIIADPNLSKFPDTFADEILEQAKSLSFGTMCPKFEQVLSNAQKGISALHDIKPAQISLLFKIVTTACNHRKKITLEPARYFGRFENPVLLCIQSQSENIRMFLNREENRKPKRNLNYDIVLRIDPEAIPKPECGQ